MDNCTCLPYVNPNVGYSLARQLMTVDDEPYMEEELGRLDRENPAVSMWIRKYGERTEDPMGSMFCALLVYKLLESQAEANKMAEEIPLG